MSAIIISPSPIAKERIKAGDLTRGDYMPLSIRVHLADELNKLWTEFATEMHDGENDGQAIAAKFWKYVLAGG